MMSRQPFTLLIHIALAIIVAGAVVTHYTGIQGKLVLWEGEAPVRTFIKTSGPGDGTLPFGVSLVKADTDYYPGTFVPMDYCSVLLIDGHEVNVSMNHVGEYDGWRFFQSGISPYGSTLAISRDVWGTGITYTGYALLGIGMIGFFFQRRTAWRALLKNRKVASLICLAMIPALCNAAEPIAEPRTPAESAVIQAVMSADAKIKAEHLYNDWSRPLPAAILALALGVYYLFAGITVRKTGSGHRIIAGTLTWLLIIYIGVIISVLWWISGHVPLSNGPEMMLFMALAALCAAKYLGSDILRGALLCVSAMTLSVAVMGGRTPQAGVLMPVLNSPLLSLHVAVIMLSYVLFLLMAVLSVVALCSRNTEREAALSRMNRLILVPAVFLLGAGMFIGAVWANQSWGRYWGWDPKETCALVMFLIYSVPMHWASRPLRCFRRPRVLHRYLLLAVLSVLFTYFGANYLLPGLHSYA